MIEPVPPNPAGKHVAIVAHGFVPIYRLKFYQLLNQLSANRYTVFHGPPPSNTGHSECADMLDFPNAKITNYKLSFLGLTTVYQPVITRILFGSFDAVVLGHELKFISTVLLFFFCKIIGKPVLWWGQGFQKDHDTACRVPFVSEMVAMIKKAIARWADTYIAYTDMGPEKLTGAGVPKEKIVVVRNTIDMDTQRSLYAKYVDLDVVKFRNDHNLRPDSIVLLYIGRIYPAKRVEELLYLIDRINSEGLCRSYVEAIVIGSGPDAEAVRKIGAEIRGIHFLGEIYDQEIIAQYMRIATAVIIPGGVGLAVNHAFAHGVPVITRQHNNHGPELNYIISGVNGLIIEGDFNNFVHATVEFLNSPECQSRMAVAAYESGKKLSMDFMVKAFDEAVSTAISRKAKNVAKRADVHVQ